MPNLVPNTAVFDTAVLEPVAFDPAAFSPNAELTDTTLAAPVQQAAKPRTAGSRRRTLGRTLQLKWDMAAVSALMLACAAYGVYALLFLTGF